MSSGGSGPETSVSPGSSVQTSNRDAAKLRGLLSPVRLGYAAAAASIASNKAFFLEPSPRSKYSNVGPAVFEPSSLIGWLTNSPAIG